MEDKISQGTITGLFWWIKLGYTYCIVFFIQNVPHIFPNMCGTVAILLGWQHFHVILCRSMPANNFSYLVHRWGRDLELGLWCVHKCIPLPLVMTWKSIFIWACWAVVWGTLMYYRISGCLLGWVTHKWLNYSRTLSSHKGSSIPDNQHSRFYDVIL